MYVSQICSRISLETLSFVFLSGLGGFGTSLASAPPTGASFISFFASAFLGGLGGFVTSLASAPPTGASFISFFASAFSSRCLARSRRSFSFFFALFSACVICFALFAKLPLNVAMSFRSFCPPPMPHFFRNSSRVLLSSTNFSIRDVISFASRISRKILSTACLGASSGFVSRLYSSRYRESVSMDL